VTVAASADHEAFLRLAVAEAVRGVEDRRGGPFGALVVKDGVVIGRGCNQVTSSHDPTAHAEVVAIRAACAALGAFQLENCDVYASCEPCPMCLGALYWARPRAVYFAATQKDAAAAGFDDSFIYDELARPADQRRLRVVHRPVVDAHAPFAAWSALAARIDY
jgi:guanine deaminase